MQVDACNVYIHNLYSSKSDLSWDKQNEKHKQTEIIILSCDPGYSHNSNMNVWMHQPIINKFTYMPKCMTKYHYQQTTPDQVHGAVYAIQLYVTKITVTCD